MPIAIAIAALLLLQTPPAAPACPPTPVPPPAALKSWSKPVPAATAAVPAQAVPLTIGRAVRAALHPSDVVDFVVTPERAPAAGSHAELAFTVARAGRYRIALGEGPWIDVVQGSRAIASVSHGHGPACSGIRKMVDFDLPAGRYLLQVSGAKAGAVTAIVARI